ncbi:MAG: hypothetical protein HKM04_09490 [Legionellales bacterium]|nr:hypothetical protein [Legionellales bacterium]
MMDTSMIINLFLPVLLLIFIGYLLILKIQHIYFYYGTPVSQICKADSGGRVMLKGTAQLLDANALVAPFSGVSCCWYTYKIEHRHYDEHGADWEHVLSGYSNNFFKLEDSSGSCVVVPFSFELTLKNSKPFITENIIDFLGQKQNLNIDMSLFTPTGHLAYFKKGSNKYRVVESWIEVGEPLSVLGVLHNINNPLITYETILSKKDRKYLAKLSSKKGVIQKLMKKSRSESMHHFEELGESWKKLMPAVSDTASVNIISSASSVNMLSTLTERKQLAKNIITASILLLVFVLLGLGIFYYISIQL